MYPGLPERYLPVHEDIMIVLESPDLSASHYSNCTPIANYPLFTAHAGE